MSKIDNVPAKTFTIPLPSITFNSDEERLSFEDAVQSATNIMQSSGYAEPDKLMLMSAGDSILIANGFDPLEWSENLWGAVAAVMAQGLAVTSAVEGNA